MSRVELRLNGSFRVIFTEYTHRELVPKHFLTRKGEGPIVHGCVHRDVFQGKFLPGPAAREQFHTRIRTGLGRLNDGLKYGLVVDRDAKQLPSGRKRAHGPFAIRKRAEKWPQVQLDEVLFTPLFAIAAKESQGASGPSFQNA